MRLIFSTASENVLKKLQNAGPVFEKAAIAYLNKSADMVVGSARDLAPRARGILAGSINKGKVKKTWGELTVTVGSNVEYAKYQEFGTGLFGPNKAPIRPKRKKMLAWKDKSGKWAFARQVSGVKPKKYLEKAVFSMQRNQNIAFAEADRIIKGSL